MDSVVINDVISFMDVGETKNACWIFVWITVWKLFKLKIEKYMIRN